MFGDLEMPEADVVAREVAERADAVVVSVDYRLCNGGVHFPVPHDDVHAAFVWAAGNTELLPSGAPWAIGGASAGGNLAAGVAQRLRDEDAGRRRRARAGISRACTIRCRPARRSIGRASRRFPPACGSRRRRRAASTGTSSARTCPTCPTPSPGWGRSMGCRRHSSSSASTTISSRPGPSSPRSLEQHGVDVRVEVVEGVTHGHLNIAGLPEALTSLQTISRLPDPLGLTAGLTRPAHGGRRQPAFAGRSAVRSRLNTARGRRR